MGKLDSNKKKKRESLLNTSFEFFTTKGIEKTSISDIVEKAGVAKGTFYLYFKDKYDIKDRLIMHKSSQLFESALNALEKEDLPAIEDKIIFMLDHILDELAKNKALLAFIHKDLSWGIFEKAIENPGPLFEDVSFANVLESIVEISDKELTEPEIMLFMIVELAGSAGYSAIIENRPCSLEELKPYLHRTVRDIVKAHTLRH
ncbi:TetR/AcrR family transcriptional regulator [Butyrivibrio sp. MC2013]|uniref:TetR/AcrR family transcriptional regulator n=1 Tax=Butyrivibrio sp. MC2013 TaxID=1280686 RepID=UPI000411843B|nr:TetR/AcrR family transcriptional regulator [Butyrivibrio sp. MC2013]